MDNVCGFPRTQGVLCCRRRHDVPAEDTAASGVDLSMHERPAEPDSSSPAVLQAAGSQVQGGSVRQQRPDSRGV